MLRSSLSSRMSSSNTLITRSTTNKSSMIVTNTLSNPSHRHVLVNLSFSKSGKYLACGKLAEKDFLKQEPTIHVVSTKDVLLNHQSSTSDEKQNDHRVDYFADHADQTICPSSSSFDDFKNIRSVKWIHDEHTVLAGTTNGVLLKCQIDENKKMIVKTEVLFQLESKKEITCIDYHAKTVAFTSTDGSIHVMSLNDNNNKIILSKNNASFTCNEERQQGVNVKRIEIWSCCFLSQDKIAFACENGRVGVLSLVKDNCCLLQESSLPEASTCVVPDTTSKNDETRFFFSIGDDRIIRKWQHDANDDNDGNSLFFAKVLEYDDLVKDGPKYDYLTYCRHFRLLDHSYLAVSSFGGWLRIFREDKNNNDLPSHHKLQKVFEKKMRVGSVEGLDVCVVMNRDDDDGLEKEIALIACCGTESKITVVRFSGEPTVLLSSKL